MVKIVGVNLGQKLNTDRQKRCEANHLDVLYRPKSKKRKKKTYRSPINIQSKGLKRKHYRDYLRWCYWLTLDNSEGFAFSADDESDILILTKIFLDPEAIKRHF